MSERNSSQGSSDCDTFIDRREYLKLAGIGAGVSTGSFGGITASSLPVQATASSGTTIDNFEDGDLSEYDVDRGQTFGTVSSPALGSHALELADDSAIEIISLTGLDAYPQAGDTFTVRFRTNGVGGGEQANLSWGVQSHTDRYYVVLNPGKQTMRLFKYENDSSIILSSEASIDFKSDAWHLLEVDWKTDGTQIITLFEADGQTQIAQVSGSDSTWTSGGIGFDAYLSTGEAVYFDEATIGAAGSQNEGSQLIVDEFNDQDLSEYNFNIGGSDVNIVSSPTPTGSSVLEIADDLGTEMMSVGGLSNYPSAGSTFSSWFRASGTQQWELYYGVHDSDNYYYIEYNFDHETLSLGCRKEGTAHGAANASAVIDMDEWYRIEAKWKRNGTHVVGIYDCTGSEIVQASYLEDEVDDILGDYLSVTSGGIGYGGRPNEDNYTHSFYLESVTIDGYDDSCEGVVVDSFEDGDLSDYDFDRGSSGASVVSSPTFDGSNALAISGTNTEMIRKTGLPNEPEAGDVFSCWVRATGGAAKLNLTYGVQDHENRYYIPMDFANNSLALFRYDGGSSILLEKTSVSLYENSWYRIEIDWRTNGQHIVSLYGQSKIEEIESNDQTWSGGGIGYDAYLASSGGTVYFDYYTKNDYRRPFVGCTVDCFEDGDLSEYNFDRGSTGASIVTDPTFFGSNALAITGTNTELISTSGLPVYPKAGDWFRCRVQATNGAAKLNVTYGVQDHENRYYVAMSFADNKFNLLRYDNGSSILLDQKTEGFDLAEDEWYRIEINWRENGTHTASLYNESEDLITRVTATDTTWTSGGIGYDAYLSSGGTVYFDHVLLDGQYNHLQELVDKHGKVQDTTVEALNDTNTQMRETYHFKDGTTYSADYEKIGNRKSFVSDEDHNYWCKSAKENDNLRKKLLQVVEHEVNGGA
jgi:hypothetical protein